MLFYEPIYLLIFLPITFFFFYFSKKIKINFKYLLICLSLFFYSWWNIYYLPLILITILLSFYIANLIKNKQNKSLYLFLGISFVLTFLLIFKYSDFIVSNLNILFHLEIPLLNFGFPLAISFYSFQIIAFLINVYDHEIKEINFIDYFLFIIFFPQLVAGPIMKYLDLVPQFNRSNLLFFNRNYFLVGLILIIIGLIKKIIFANYLGQFVDSGYNNLPDLNILHCWLISFSFTFQFYFDFTGYVDMAMGSALLLNIKLSKNFDSPFKAYSLINFWQRWHITLTSFLTNFVYMPLVRSIKQISFFKSMIVLFVVFFLAGLWHGPSWNFIIFGIIHGLGLIINQIKIYKFISCFITFNYVNFSFIFFRSNEIYEAIFLIKKMIGLNNINKLENNDYFEYFYNSISLEFIIIFILSIIICFFCKNSNYLVEKALNGNKQ